MGLGVDVSLKVSELGTNYSDQVVANQYPEDIVNTGYTNRLSAYVTPSYRLGKFIIGIRLGFYESQFYQNRYNNIMGVYYIIATATDKAMFGGFIEYRISKTIGISLGGDNYNAGTLGISARL